MPHYIQSPEEARVLGMTRILLLLGEWRREMGDAPLEFDRLAVMDFAAQYPRFSGILVPSVARVSRAYGLEEVDLGDLFARRNFETARVHVQSLLVGLVSRALAEEKVELDVPGGAFVLTAAGFETTTRFSSRLSWALRALYRELVQAWSRSSVERVGASLREQLPQSAPELATYRQPFDVDSEAAWPRD